MLEHSREKFRCYFVATHAVRQIEIAVSWLRRHIAEGARESPEVATRRRGYAISGWRLDEVIAVMSSPGVI
jgi:hypothetical protein